MIRGALSETTFLTQKEVSNDTSATCSFPRNCVLPRKYMQITLPHWHMNNVNSYSVQRRSFCISILIAYINKNAYTNKITGAGGDLNHRDREMKVVALVSGGKDSCYVMMKCIQYGHEIVALANLLPVDDSVDELDSYMYQTVGHQIIVS
ncbi:hypothetical protein YC2023_100477 [Brassica napus]